jgi:hypothetical protein
MILQTQLSTAFPHLLEKLTAAHLIVCHRAAVAAAAADNIAEMAARTKLGPWSAKTSCNYAYSETGPSGE